MTQILTERMKSVNEEYFQLAELPGIEWSRGVIKKKYRKITFGTYDIKKNRIRIHPILKNEFIPQFLLDFVIFHELLHYQDRHELVQMQALSQPSAHKALFHKLRKYGRKKENRIHSKDFHNREKEFPQREAASRIMREIAKGNFHPENYKI